MATLNVSKFGETFDSGNAEPSQGIPLEGVEARH